MFTVDVKQQCNNNNNRLPLLYVAMLYFIVSIFISSRVINQHLIDVSDVALLNTLSMRYYVHNNRGWSGGAMVLGKLSVPGRPTVRITVGQGPTALAVGAGGG